MNRSHFLKSLLGVALIPFVPARKEPGLTMDELCTMASELPAPNKLEPINLEYRMLNVVLNTLLVIKIIGNLKFLILITRPFIFIGFMKGEIILLRYL